MPKPNDRIGPYELIRKLGKGAFGEVWLAHDVDNLVARAPAVALKLPLDDDVDLDAIRQEATVWVAASGHANVLPMLEARLYDGQVVIASEYAPDGSLQQWLKAHGGKAPSQAAALEMTRGILAGLSHLHSRRIVHRDLKPDNILLKVTTPRLADFGLSRVLRSTSMSAVVAGTPVYMAPEAFKGKRNSQTDLWSVGVMLYQMLSGRFPFLSNDKYELYVRITNDEPAPIEAPPWLQQVVAKALSKNPAERFQTAEEMLEALTEPKPMPQPKSQPVPVFREAVEVETIPVKPKPRRVEPAPRPRPQPEPVAPKQVAPVVVTPASKQSSRLLMASVVAAVIGIGGISYTAFQQFNKVTPIVRDAVLPDLGDEFTETKINLDLLMKRVPGGSFMMGSPTDEVGGYGDERPQHRVTVSDFYIGKFEITQAQWQAVMGNTPTNFTGDLKRPIEGVSWNDVQEFCRKLNALTGKTYSLPSEAEWEYAARAKTKTPYAGDLDAMAWYSKNSGNTTHPVGQKQPNAFGLYDMHGNVWEWCEDVWHDSYGGQHGNPPTNGSAWLSGGDSSRRVLRGGSWYNDGTSVRSACRYNAVPGARGIFYSLRLVLSARTP